MNIQHAETETAGNCDLFFPFHVQVPDDEPREYGEGKVHDDKPGWCLSKVRSLTFDMAGAIRGTHIQLPSQVWQSQANNNHPRSDSTSSRPVHTAQ